MAAVRSYALAAYVLFVNIAALSAADPGLDGVPHPKTYYGVQQQPGCRDINADGQGCASHDTGRLESFEVTCDGATSYEDLKDLLRYRQRLTALTRIPALIAVCSNPVAVMRGQPTLQTSVQLCFPYQAHNQPGR